MNSIWIDSLWHQFSASIGMLEHALQNCPDELWEACLWEDHSLPEGGTAYWNIAYHTLFFLDLYLSGTVEEFKPPEPFTLDELEDGKVTRVFTREELTAYLEHGRRKCQATFSELTDERAKKKCKFPWGELTFAELLIDNMRHVQEHAAQLNMFLGQKKEISTRWLSNAKK